MKVILSLTTLAIITWSTSATALHAYRNEDCRSATHELSYDGNYAVGGDYSIKRIGSDAKTLILPNNEEIYGRPLVNSDITFVDVKTLSVVENQGSRESCFDYSSSRTVKVIKFDNVKLLTAIKLGIRQGTEMTFTCDEGFQIPNGIDCN